MSVDWLPSRRDEILGMAMKWNNVLVVKGAAWNVPETKSSELNALTLTAQAAGIHHYLQKPPVSGNELPHSHFTRRKREQFDFPAETSGMTVYFCIRYENSKGKSGPWGPMFSAIIP